MALSSSVLFHFTSSLEILKKILYDLSFWPRYCEEYGWPKRIAIPMCCFSDIPLSQIKTHMSYYGCYGIGLSKEWALKNKDINPVFYVSYEFKRTLSLLTKDYDETNYQKAAIIISRIKHYKGKNIDRVTNNTQLDYVYYDEREWRYVPSNLEVKKLCLPINSEKIPESWHKFTDTQNCRLNFAISDISYLIVSKEEERLELLEYIEWNLHDKINSRDALIIKSKILTKHQIDKDF